MPIAGAARKPPGQAVTRNKPIHEWIDVPNVPFKRGPGLPKHRPNLLPWPAQAREKWQAWRTLPHCVLWGPAEWQFAFDTIELAARLYDPPKLDSDGHPAPWPTSALIELRDRERAMGTTFDYRRALRIRYVPAKSSAPAGADDEVTRLDDYRNL